MGWRATAARCVRHPESTAPWRCAACGDAYCDPCVQSPPVRGVSLRLCPVCLGRGQIVATPREEGLPVFLRALPGVLRYPLVGRGPLVLLAGAVIFAITAQILSVTVIGSMLIALVVGGYVCAFMMKVLSTSADGDDEVPEWPDLTDFYEDLVVPLGLFVAALLVSLGPAWLYLRWRGVEHVFDPAFLVVLGAGALYLPMAWTALSIFRRASALSPHVVLPGVAKVGWAYLVACVGLAAIITLRLLAARSSVGLPALAFSVVDGVVSFYCLTVEMRVLGVMYRTHQGRLGWFP